MTTTMKKRIELVDVMLLLVGFMGSGLVVSAANAFEQCELIEHVSQCKQMPWNSTRFPNLLMHRNQMEVSRLFDEFARERQCRSRLVLCSLLVPVCTNIEADAEGPIVLRPCLSFCLRLCPNLHECRSLLLDDTGTCFQPPEEDILKAEDVLYLDSNRRGGGDLEEIRGPTSMMTTTTIMGEHQKFILIMAAITFALSLFAMLSYLIDRRRFRYPELCTCVMCLLYLPLDLSYILSSSIRIDAEKPIDSFIGRFRCGASFIVVQASWISGSAWFACLGLTWFLAASLKWSHEAIGRFTRWIRLLISTFPLVLVVVLWLTSTMGKDIELQSLTRICSPTPKSRLASILSILHVISLLFSSTFLLLGFVSLFRTRTIIKRDSGARKLGALMLRIGIFSVLYLVPSFVVVVCNYNPWNFESAPLLKHVSILTVALASSSWVWCPKTTRSWKKWILSNEHHAGRTRTLVPIGRRRTEISI